MAGLMNGAKGTKKEIEYEGKELLVYWRIQDASSESNLFMSPAEFAMLRAILCTLDENEPPKVGDSLGCPVRIGGIVTARLTKELLELK